VKKKKRRNCHINQYGRFCHCSFGDAEPYVSPHKQEVYGSTHESGIWKEASKMEWLRDRPDLQDDESQHFLNALEHHFKEPEHDALFPWLARERKKNRLHHNNSGSNDWFYTPSFPDADGRWRTLEPDDLSQVADYLHYKKQSKQGIDIMAHHIAPLLQQAEKEDGGGEVVHSFDDDPHAYAPGYTIKRLRNKRDMVKEGQRMDHCVGSNGMGYIEKNNEGLGAYYSLRDGNNTPLVTIEMTPKADEYAKCPHCGKFTFGQGGHNGMVNCENCGGRLGELSQDYNYQQHRYPPVWDEGVQSFPNKINHAKPKADHMQVAQMFGKSDVKAEDEHEGLVNRWLGSLGHDYYYSDGDERYDDEDEEPEYEPWWDSYYHGEAPESFEDLQRHDEDPYWNAPEEFHRAHRDAADNGLEGPDFEPGEADAHTIFDNYANDIGSNYRHVDPDEIKQFYELAKNHGIGTDWLDAAQNWLETEYKPYLDPYGQHGGPGYNLDGRQPIPRDPSGPGAQGVAPELPGAHYPEQFPQEEYFARNLKHHLEENRDPQTGYNQSPWQKARDYPREPHYQMPPPSAYETNPEALREPYEFGEGEQQGGLFGKNWYVDINKKRLVESELPPHLYPPDHYVPTGHDPNAGWSGTAQQKLWENVSPTAVAPAGASQPWNFYPDMDAYPSPDEQADPYAKGNLDHAAAYHPTQDEEWADPDEPVFSAVIPEPRWQD
jgi:hypothetical protein